MTKIDFKEIEDAIWGEVPTQIGDVVVRDLYPTKPYIYALQKALYLNKYADLYKLLQSKTPLHPEFLPILSLVLMRSKAGEGGRRPEFTPVQKACIHRLVTEKCFRENLSIHKACLEIEALSSKEKIIGDAELGELDVSTIRRAFDSIDKELFGGRFTKLFGDRSKPTSKPP
jgi:hypothetical protein